MFWVKYDKWNPNSTVLIHTITFLRGLNELNCSWWLYCETATKKKIVWHPKCFSANNDVIYIHAVMSCDGEEYIPMNIPIVFFLFYFIY